MWPVVDFKTHNCDIYIGRPSKWGSPYMVGPNGNREEVLILYEGWLMSRPDVIAEARRELRGKVLGCWCAPRTCHGDVLTRIANGWQLAMPLTIEE